MPCVPQRNNATFVHRRARKIGYSRAMIVLLRRLLALIVSVALGFAAPAQAQQHLPAPQPVKQRPLAAPLHPALWKVTRGDTTIYLFGTIHALPPGLDWLDGTLADALDSAQELVTEIPDEDPAAVQTVVMRLAILPKGKSLRSLLPIKEQRALEQALAANGLPPGGFDRFKPWYAGIVLASLPLLREGYAGQNGVEKALSDRAAAQGKRHIGLETVEYQLGLFDALPWTSQRRFLADVIKEMPKVKDELDRMVAEWGQGHAERIAEMLNEQNDDPAMAKVLIVDRNKHWADWIKARLDQPGTVFIAVGAGHLAGKQSVQAQLSAMGIDAARVQ